MTRSAWTCRRLTDGTQEGRYDQHSYYDIHVFDDESRRIAAYALGFMNRDVTADDVVTVGYVDTGAGDAFVSLGESRAFSLQQGPMAQWLPSRKSLIWNDRERGSHVARIHGLDGSGTRTLACPIYAVSPDGRTGLSLDMARLDGLRPGYGYTGTEGGGSMSAVPPTRVSGASISRPASGVSSCRSPRPGTSSCRGSEPGGSSTSLPGTITGSTTPSSRPTAVASP